MAEISRAEINAIEVFCAPSHFNSSATSKRHSPTERELAPGRQSGVPISICDPERIRRVDAVDEVKRALEVAERIPFRFLVQHLGHSHETMNARALDGAFNSLEHLAIFAKERGVIIALENTPSEFGSPESLCQLIQETHLRDLKFCFDTGHAHMADGIPKSSSKRCGTNRDHARSRQSRRKRTNTFCPSKARLIGTPPCGSLASLPALPALVLELKEQPAGKPSLDQIREAFDKLERHLGDTRGRNRLEACALKN